MKRFYFISILVVLFISGGWELNAQEKYDSAAVAQLIDEGINRSSVMEYLSYLSDVYGPRLIYSPAYKRAAMWEMQKLSELGLENSHLESWLPIGKSWTLNRYSANVICAQNWPLISFPKAWSPGTKGAVTGDIIYIDAQTDTEVAAYKGKVKGKFLMMDSLVETRNPFEPLAHREADSSLLDLANADMMRRGGGRRRFELSPEMRKRMALNFSKIDLCLKEGALGVLTASRGDGGNVFVQNATVSQSPDTPDSLRFSAQNPKCPKIPLQISVGAEHYNRIFRMIQKGEKPKLELNVDVTTGKTDSGYNIIADLPGSDLKEEVVIIGAHFDTWHGGTGATDDGTGTAVCMEAMRILKTLGLQPRRTIRIGLWGGEEQGFLGSRGYVKAHLGERSQSTGEGAGGEISYLPDAEKFDVYFNNDNGGGKVRGIYMQGNEATRPIFRAWLRPFDDLGASTISVRNTGGTDHLAFDGINLPGFQFIQDPIDYGTRTHHSIMDLYERVLPEDLKQAATVMAVFAYNAAMRDEKFPHKPVPKPEKPAGSN